MRAPTHPRRPIVGLLLLWVSACNTSDNHPDGRLDLKADGRLDLKADRPPDLTADARPSFGPQVELNLAKAMDSYWNKQQPPGAIAAVRRNLAYWTRAKGKADLTTPIAMTSDHRFRIGSVTKTFVATLVLLLQEENVLSVEDKLSKWIPAFPNGDAIPLYRLLNHTSGIYNFSEAFTLSAGGCPPQAKAAPEDLVQVAIDHGPVSAPGAQWRYSNTNYILLGQVIEAATKKKWPVVQREKVLDRFGLGATYVEGHEPSNGDAARGYQLNSGTFVDVTSGYSFCYWSAGGVVSTVADLTRFINLLEEGAILSPSSLKQMREQYATPIPTTETLFYAGYPATAMVSYGLGLMLIVDGSERYSAHAGLVLGFNTYLARRQRDGLAVTAFVNANETPAVFAVRPLFEALP